jgi:hypothetical protein
MCSCIGTVQQRSLFFRCRQRTAFRRAGIWSQRGRACSLELADRRSIAQYTDDQASRMANCTNGYNSRQQETSCLMAAGGWRTQIQQGWYCPKFNQFYPNVLHCEPKQFGSRWLWIGPCPPPVPPPWFSLAGGPRDRDYQAATRDCAEDGGQLAQLPRRLS